MDNSSSFVETILNIWNAGNSVALFDMRWPILKIIETMRDIGSDECYIDDDILEKNRGFIPNDIKINQLLHNNGMQYLSDNIFELFNHKTNKEEAVILFSSGTTGVAKGIMLSHEAIYMNASKVIEYMKPNNNDTIFITKPLIHSSTLVGELLVSLITKTKLLISSSKILPQKILRVIANEKVTILCTNPLMLSCLMESNNDSSKLGNSLRTIYVSGSVSSKEMLTEAARIFENTNIYNVYGFTEAGPRVSGPINEDRYVIGSVGQPLPGVSIKILDNNGKEVAPHERGCVFVNTPCRFTGYAISTFKGNENNHEWINSKDIGYFDAKGNLYIVGRLDNAILISSHVVYPEQIENIISEHERICKCCIIGIKDYLHSEIMCCFYESSHSMNVVEIKKFCKEKLASYEIPQRFIRVDKIPANTNGKIDRKKLKEKFL